MKKQLQLEQIQEALARRKGYTDVLFDLSNYGNILKKEYDSKMFEYVPVKIVASFEEYFRGKYKEIIDNAEYRKHLKEVEVLKNLNFDFNILGAFQDNEITLGDYLSYLIPCNKFEDINGTLSKLLGFIFVEKIKVQTDVGPKLFDSINEIFRLRHIFCHEVQQTEKISFEKATGLIHDACTFLAVADSIISDTLYSDSPQTTVEMLVEAERMLEESERELESLIDTIKSKDQDGDLLSANFDYLDVWKQYREARAKSDASMVEGGTMYPIVYTLNLEIITKAFIKELKNEYKYLLR